MAMPTRAALGACDAVLLARQGGLLKKTAARALEDVGAGIAMLEESAMVALICPTTP